MIVCLRRARAWGLMSETLHMQDSSAPIWTKILSALSSPEQQVCVCNCLGLPSVCLSVCHSIHPYVCLSVSPSIWPAACLCLSFHSSVCLCVPFCLSMPCLSTHVFVCQSICLPADLSVSSVICLPLCACLYAVCLPVHPCPCLSVCLQRVCVWLSTRLSASVCSSVCPCCLSVHLWVCLSIDPPADLSLHCLSMSVLACLCLSVHLSLCSGSRSV